MALKVRDLLKLKQMRRMELIAGEKGLDNVVVTSNIADYEFAPGVTPDNSLVFEAHSFVVSSLLYAKDNPEMLLPSIKALYEYNASAFAFKDIIYKEMPQEIIDFANDNDFPIFKFSTGTYFENIIFEVMDAVQHDDNHYLSEGNIELMINKEMNSSDVLNIARGLSMEFSEYTLAAYVKSKTASAPLNIEYLLRLFLTSKGLRNKAILATYNGGIFILMTSSSNDISKYEIMLKEILEFLSLNSETISVSLSNTHKPFGELDKCYRESYHTHKAAISTGNAYRNYNEIGLFQLTLNLADSKEYADFTEDKLLALRNHQEHMETAIAWVKFGGNLNMAAKKLDCHVNTVRYRLNQIKQYLDSENLSEYELFSVVTVIVHRVMSNSTYKV